MYNRPSRVLLGPVSEQGKLGTDGLSAAGRCGNKNVLVCSVERVERLRLNLVKVFPLRIERNIVLGLQGGHRQWLEIQELRVRGELVGQKQLLEGNG